MAPVDPQSSPSLGPVLDLIERWQQGEKQWHSRSQAETALLAVDVAATRQLAEQHAAQLRSVVGSDLTDNGTEAINAAVDAAADFLAAPRREPEAE